MSDALVERRPSARFFCHRCNIEFEDVLQDYTCPYCASGFIEQLENEADGSVHSGDDFSDADMSNLDDSDDTHHSGGIPLINDLALLMSGGRTRGTGRPETLLEQLVWTIGGGAGGGAGGGVNMAAGTPMLLVGAPGDYVFGGEGLDVVVTTLLGQLEHAGPPPLPREQINAIPSEDVTQELAATNTSCSICWENFLLGEKVSHLECEHKFHSPCIDRWLQLHATCPICRRSLLPPARADAAPTEQSEPDAEQAIPSTPALPRVLLRRLPRRRVSGPQTHTWDSTADTSSSGSTSTSASATPSVTASGVWAPSTRMNITSSSSSSSLNSSNDRDRAERQFNMDIDFD